MACYRVKLSLLFYHAVSPVQWGSNIHYVKQTSPVKSTTVLVSELHLSLPRYAKIHFEKFQSVIMHYC